METHTTRGTTARFFRDFRRGIALTVEGGTTVSERLLQPVPVSGLTEIAALAVPDGAVVVVVVEDV